MNWIKKTALFLAITAALFLTSCKVQKQINKTETSQESEAKVDSSATVKNDITKESKIETVVTEVIDTTVQVNSKGEIVSDTTGQKTTAVKVKKTKTKKTKADIRETDQSKVKIEVKRESKKEETKKETVKDVQKSGTMPWWLWIILLILVVLYLSWRYLRR